MIHQMHHELERVHHTRCTELTARKRQAMQGQARVRGKASRVWGVRILPWAGLLMLSTLASLAFGAEATRALSYSEGSYDHSTMPLSNTVDEQLPMHLVCWPIVVGGDTECVDTP